MTDDTQGSLIPLPTPDLALAMDQPDAEERIARIQAALAVVPGRHHRPVPGPRLDRDGLPVVGRPVRRRVPRGADARTAAARIGPGVDGGGPVHPRDRRSTRGERRDGARDQTAQLSQMTQLTLARWSASTGAPAPTSRRRTGRRGQGSPTPSSTPRPCGQRAARFVAHGRDAHPGLVGSWPMAACIGQAIGAPHDRESTTARRVIAPHRQLASRTATAGPTARHEITEALADALQRPYGRNACNGDASTAQQGIGDDRRGERCAMDARRQTAHEFRRSSSTTRRRATVGPQCPARPRPTPPPPARREATTRPRIFVEWMMGLPEGHVTGRGLPRSQPAEDARQRRRPRAGRPRPRDPRTPCRTPRIGTSRDHDHVPPADPFTYNGRKQRMIPDEQTGEMRPYQRVCTFAKTLSPTPAASSRGKRG